MRPRRGAVLAVAALIAVAFMCSTLVTPLYDLYRRDFGFSEIVLTLIYAVYGLGNLGALLFLGRLSDRAGRRAIALIALALAAGAGIVFVFAQAVPPLFVARLLTGFAVGLASGTGTAWLAELYGGTDRTAATLMATCGNMAGASAGPLYAALLAQYAPWPLRLPYIVYLAVLAVTAAALARTPETVERRAHRLSELDFRPRVGVPRAIAGQFIAPAVTGFGIWALAGFYFALLPGVLARDLGEKNLVVGGAIVCLLMSVAGAVIVVTRRLRSVDAMTASLVLLLPSAALLVLGQALRSMPVVLAGAVCTGVALGLGYRGGLQVVNEIAPPDSRAAVASSYFIVCFIGNSIPIIGISVVSALASARTADVAFACTIGAFAVAALFARARYAPARA